VCWSSTKFTTSSPVARANNGSSSNCSGPHGLSEIVYAYASSAADNGSSFARLNANAPWYNVTTGIVMYFGRVAHAIPILAIAGSCPRGTRG
jgi:potassium-transporting ATPase potassium-binding subunit